MSSGNCPIGTPRRSLNNININIRENVRVRNRVCETILGWCLMAGQNFKVVTILC